MWRVLICIGAVMLLGCGDPVSPRGESNDAHPPAVASVIVTPITGALNYLGSTIQLNANAEDANGNSISGKTFAWTSSNMTVAHVNTSGLATAFANGITEISATTDGISGVTTIVVDQMGSQLVFSTQPTTAVKEEAIAPEVVVTIQDSGGSIVADADVPVTVDLSTNPGNGALLGTKTTSAVAGFATFTNLSIDRAGVGYSLSATSGTLDGATSVAFDIWSAAAQIDSVILDSDTLSIDGFSGRYTATVTSIGSNPTSAIVLQAYIDQASVSRAAGGTAVRCGLAIGTLPPGTCSFIFGITASNKTAGSGYLVPGAATARFELKNGISGTVLGTFATPITLVEFVEPPLPSAEIESVTLSATTLTLGGPFISYTAIVKNDESTILPGVGLQGWIDQGAASRAAGGSMVMCNGVIGELPPGTCSFSFSLTATNRGGGTGTLVPGAATAKIELKDQYGRIVDTARIPVTLVP